MDECTKMLENECKGSEKNEINGQFYVFFSSCKKKEKKVDAISNFMCNFATVYYGGECEDAQP